MKRSSSLLFAPLADGSFPRNLLQSLRIERNPEGLIDVLLSTFDSLPAKILAYPCTATLFLDSKPSPFILP